MRLRIISGEFKGRVLNLSIRGRVNYRPTLERVRESVLEIVKNDLHEAHIADLCAGSGLMGFEMLSRGAATVDFVEENRTLTAQIEKNADILGLKTRISVFRQNVCSFIAVTKKKYDLVYYDPPYDNAELAELVPRLSDLLVNNGILIYERRRQPQDRKSIKQTEENIVCDKRIFGNTVIEIIRFKNN